ncbi:MAG: ATP-binding cassette domain-containing protein [Synergistaceae bacterium]|jgi:oligopeptide/dipeptide ABC transporter ATP-binding protein|nr:ATP-binding cassette domain-containing protein [Synergistaceae bacterium]
MTDELLLEVRNLTQYFERPVSWLERVFGGKQQKSRVVHAVNGVSFAVRRGEVFGLVGESGCGKSTTARTVVGLLPPKGGEILFASKDITGLSGAKLTPLRRKIQMVFQNPYASLDPRQRIEDILTEPILFHESVSRADARERAMALLDKIGLHRDQARRYPHQFSGGQRQRIAIARALATGPELVVADEPVSALDVSVQAQILNLMMDLKDEFDLSYLFIAHDLSVVRHVADRLAVMYLGFVVESGSSEEVFERPLHPYTVALLDAAPSLAKKSKSVPLTGDAPSPVNLPPGCPFASRCPKSRPECETERPTLREVSESSGRLLACHQQ